MGLLLGSGMIMNHGTEIDIYHAFNRAYQHNSWKTAGLVEMSLTVLAAVLVTKNNKKKNHHIEVETKWMPFCIQQFQINFLVWKLLYLELSFTEIGFQESN